MDLSKNKISLTFDNEFFELIKHSTLSALELSQNIDIGKDETSSKDPNLIRFMEKTKLLSNIKVIL